MLITYEKSAPIFEFRIDFNSQKDTDLMILWKAEPKAVYLNYGTGVVQKRLALLDDYLAAAYFDEALDLFTIVVYSRAELYQPGQVPEIHRIVGGREFREIEWTPFSAFTFWAYPIVIDKSAYRYGLFMPSVSYDESAILAEVNGRTYIEVLGGVTQSQTLTLGLYSGYDKKAKDITGKLVPFEAWELRTEAFCLVTKELFREPFYMYNSLNVTEQYVISDFVVGYNLSYEIVTDDRKSEYALTQSLKLRDESFYAEAEAKQTVLGVSQFGFTNGNFFEAKLYALANNGTLTYKVEFDFSDDETVPLPTKTITLNTPAGVRCYDVVMPTY